MSQQTPQQSYNSTLQTSIKYGDSDDPRFLGQASLVQLLREEGKQKKQATRPTKTR